MQLITMPSVEFEAGSKGDFAVRYANIGWHVFPLWWIGENGKCACGKEDCIKNAGKHPYSPLAPFGHKMASNEAVKVSRWWQSEPNCNIGVYLSASDLCAIDIDPRNGGIETIDELESKHGQIVSDVLQYTGGGGEHRVFTRPSGSMPGKLGPGVDVKLEGYIVVEPSDHQSGGKYEWEASSNPLDGCAASPLPDWIRDLSGSSLIRTGIEAGERTGLTDSELSELWDALQWIKSPDRDRWYQVGMAIHNDVGGQTGFDIWDRWSSTNGATYDPADQIRVWRSFKRKGIEGITKASIFQWAMESGFANIPQPEETAESIKAFLLKLINDAKHQKVVDPLQSEWIIPVKSLQDIADWFGTLSEEPHPIISMVGALALGAVITGRKYRSVNANWTAMQYVLLAPSGIGKNYIKSGINRLLHAADLSDFFGANFYTHSAAVYWALHQAPNHICVTDEFGDSFAEARKSDSGNKMTVFKALKQVYSDVDDTYRADAYSMSGLSKRDRDEKKMPPVVRPSLTLLGLATPGQFYTEIKAAHIEGGMMNRFVVFNVGRDGVIMDSPMGDGIPPPEIIANIRKVRRIDDHAKDDERNVAFDIAPLPIVVNINPDAVEIFRKYKSFARSAGAALEPSGMGNMPLRWRENAMRIATMLAAWDDPERPVISGEVADWCCRLVRFCGEETIRQLVNKVAESDYGQTLNQVLATIKEAGVGNWVSKSDLLRKHRGIKSREMSDILSHLAEAALILSQVEAGHKGGGRGGFLVTACPD